MNSLYTGNSTIGETPLQSGHLYRVQVMVHDGDQNQSGGDVGEACGIVNISQAYTQPTLTITASSATINSGTTPPAVTPKYVGFTGGDTAPTTAPTCSDPGAPDWDYPGGYV